MKCDLHVSRITHHVSLEHKKWGRAKAARIPAARPSIFLTVYVVGTVPHAVLRDRLGLDLLLVLRDGWAVAPAAHEIGLRGLAAVLALDRRVGDLARDQADAADRIVVARDDIVDQVRVAVG